MPSPARKRGEEPGDEARVDKAPLEIAVSGSLLLEEPVVVQPTLSSMVHGFSNHQYSLGQAFTGY